MLVNPHRRRIDHLHIAIVGFGDGGHDPVPHTGLAPANEPIVAGRVRAIILRERTPRRARSKHPENTIQDTPVIHPWHATRLVRQQRLDHTPLEIRQRVSLHPMLPTVWKLESHQRRFRNPFYGFMT
jgi:hypothetical protein